MDDIRRRSVIGVRPETFQFAGAARDMSRVRPEMERPFKKAEEMDLAGALLKVTNDAELKQLLERLIKKVGQGNIALDSNTIAPIGEVLKAVAKKAVFSLPSTPNTSLGTSRGQSSAGKIGSLVGQALDAHTAGMPPLESALEKSRQFVSMAGEALKAAAAAPTGANPIALVQKSLADMAKEKLASKAQSAGALGVSTAGNSTQSVSAATLINGGPARELIRAAGAAPAGSNKIALVQQSLAAAVKDKLANKAQSAESPRSSAMGVMAATSMNAGPAINLMPRQEPSAALSGTRTCMACHQPFGSCQCQKTGQSGRWIRRGNTIIVNC